ncbi:hypothetical protein [Oenococcus sp.]|uniref:hypothetical protein n=1 Tax=Oenococcus sp. TaxID=1979414 RepID=UPI0039ED78DA
MPKKTDDKTSSKTWFCILLIVFGIILIIMYYPKFLLRQPMNWMNLGIVFLFLGSTFLVYKEGDLIKRFKAIKKKQFINFEVYVALAFLVLSAVFAYILIKSTSHNHLADVYGPLFTGTGTIFSVFMALYLHDRSVVEGEEEKERESQKLKEGKEKEKKRNSLPRWLMPQVNKEIFLLSNRGAVSYVDSVRYFYYISRDDGSNTRKFPQDDQSDNFLGNNGIVFSGEIYNLDKLNGIRRISNSDGADFLIISSISEYRQQTIFIEGHGISAGHFLLTNNHLEIYSAPEEIMTNQSKKDEYTRLALECCSKFSDFDTLKDN